MEDTHESPSDVPDPPTPAVGYAGVFSDLLPIALWRADADGHVVQWSLAARELLGYSPEELIGRHLKPVLVPETHWELADRLLSRVRSGEAVVGSLPVRHRDGHMVEMETWICPSADEQGRTGILVVSAETSAVVGMRDSLAAMEGLFAQSPIGLAMLGPDLRFRRVNEALARMTGVPAPEHIGKRVGEVAPDINAAGLEAVMRQVLDTGEAVVDLRRPGRTPADPDRERIWSCSYAPLLDGSGSRLGVIASLIDITEAQLAHTEVEQARERLALLAAAGTQIGTTLNLRRTAEEVAQVLVPQLADSADVHLLEEVLGPDGAPQPSTQGWVRRVAVIYTDPAAPQQDLAVGMTYQVPRESVYEQVIANGRAINLYLSDIPALITDPGAERLRDYLRRRIGASRLVPLVARGTVLGAVIVTRTRDREPFDDQECLLMDEVVSRAALNIDNARMYTSERRAALTLQRSLMNTSLPTVTGLDLTARYLPASAHEVGGDWFDVIALPDGRTGLVIGDVMGHGIHAAAVMGQLRTALRTLARHDIPPAEMLVSLDAAVADFGENEMATCVYAVHDPAAGEVLISRAGHPPPVVADTEGRVRFVEAPPGPPLGAGGGDFQAERVLLPPESLLVMYTDGLVEARDRDLGRGMHELTHALEKLDRPLEEICDGLLNRMLPPVVQDDVAVLLARPSPRAPLGR
ncbi:SpoIIE family protein phosphatase [Streptomyces sp. NPDC047108]|uniref:SpoIIE family protein phosphatase n=1 Tax=Streptomyces sp. NPDC047108 TaxID=3155025 RepID=UPI0033FAEE17